MCHYVIDLLGEGGSDEMTDGISLRLLGLSVAWRVRDGNVIEVADKFIEAGPKVEVAVSPVPRDVQEAPETWGEDWVQVQDGVEARDFKAKGIEIFGFGQGAIHRDLRVRQDLDVDAVRNSVQVDGPDVVEGGAQGLQLHAVVFGP